MRRLLSLNIYQKNYLDQSIPYISHLKPDIICLQEVCRDDFELIRATLKYEGLFIPTINIGRVTSTQFGIAILTSGEIMSHHSSYYSDQHESLKERTTSGVLVAAISFKDGETFIIANTHGVWTQDGRVTPYQLRAIDRLLAGLGTIPKLILCGDFNAPRGRQAWARIGQVYADNIPSEVTTTIDGGLHRAGYLLHVVDGIFSTPHYTVKDVRIISGLSDHCAIVAEIGELNG